MTTAATPEALEQALAYLKPYETNSGSVSLRAPKAREAVAVIETALATATAEAASLRVEVEALKGALKPFADMDATDPPEGVPLNEWLPAVKGARVAIRTALARAATAREGRSDG